MTKDADQKAIKDSFRKLARKYYPDRSKEPNTEEKLKEIAEAYAVLSDPKKNAKSTIAVALRRSRTFRRRIFLEGSILTRYFAEAVSVLTQEASAAGFLTAYINKADSASRVVRICV